MVQHKIELCLDVKRRLSKRANYAFKSLQVPPIKDKTTRILLWTKTKKKRLISRLTELGFSSVASWVFYKGKVWLRVWNVTKFNSKINLIFTVNEIVMMNKQINEIKTIYIHINIQCTFEYMCSVHRWFHHLRVCMFIATDYHCTPVLSIHTKEGG